MRDAAVRERNELLLRHYKLARRIARQKYHQLPKVLELDDLISAAVLGLIEAIERFDPTRGIPFEAYAKYRVRGAVVDALRAADWTPRSVRRKRDRVEGTRRTLRERLGRKPTRDEMAGSMGLTGHQYDHMVQDARIRKVLSLDAPATDDGSMLIELVPSDEDPADDCQHREILSVMLRECSGLPDPERRAISMYYFSEMKLKEVGTEMGVSESRVCQLCRQGIERLRKRMALRLAA
ncbi:MAG: FliA/WhiG family RNA polymerase sigma factor [Deltaproteobacteria bacterium]|nr:FliA/WhiG family RNA polymerase sigma factor [Deltaproteobacteria bacterium]